MALLPDTQTDVLGKSWTLNESLCDTIAGLKSEMRWWIGFHWSGESLQCQSRKERKRAVRMANHCAWMVNRQSLCEEWQSLMGQNAVMFAELKGGRSWTGRAIAKIKHTCLTAKKTQNKQFNFFGDYWWSLLYSFSRCVFLTLNWP